MRSTFFCILFLLFAHSVDAQNQNNYINYYQTILVIEELIANEKFSESIPLYLKLTNNYNHVFARDAYNAFQIAALTHDTSANTFYFQCAKSGVPKYLLHNNLLASALIENDTSHFNALYKKGQQIYYSKIDINLRNEFKERFALEQSHKSKPDYKSICYDNFNRIQTLATNNQFPGEQVIGVDDELENSYVFATLLHYPYSYTKLHNVIEEQVLQGNIQPLCALYLYGFNQTRTSVLYTYYISVDTMHFKTCYNLPFGLQSKNLAEVNQQRKIKFISSINVHESLQMIMNKYQLDYKFGY